MSPKNIFTGSLFIVSLFFLVFAAIQIHYIDQEICTQCGVCVDECPEEAIVVVEKDGEEIHVIDQEKCTQCGICIDECPEEAIFVGDPENAKGKKKK